MKHKITVRNSKIEQETSIIRQCIIKTLDMENFPYLTRTDVRLVTDYEMERLNKKHRNINKTTDVLSFPMEDFVDGKCDYDLAAEINMQDGLIFLGDIIISKDMVETQAVEFGHNLTRELAYLSVHSCLHLLGYDHTCDDRKSIMRKREDAVLSALGIHRDDK